MKESYAAYKKRRWIPIPGIIGLDTWKNVNDGELCHFVRIEREKPVPVARGKEPYCDEEEECVTKCEFCGSQQLFRYVYDSYLYDYVLLCVPCMKKIIEVLSIQNESNLQTLPIPDCE